MLKGRQFSSSNFIFAWLCAVCLTLSLTGASAMMAPAAYAQAPSDISKAYFQSGWFEKNPSGEWDEYDAKGNLRYTFREIRRNDNSVFLHNKQYGVNIEIDTREQQVYAEWPGRPRHVMHKITNMEIMAPPPVVTTPPAVGTPPKIPVATPEVTTTPPPVRFTGEESSIWMVSGATYDGGTFTYGSQGWTETNSEGASHQYREIGHEGLPGNTRIYLYDNSRNHFVILDLSKMEIFDGKGQQVQPYKKITGIQKVEYGMMLRTNPAIPMLPNIISGFAGWGNVDPETIDRFRELGTKGPVETTPPTPPVTGTPAPGAAAPGAPVPVEPKGTLSPVERTTCIATGGKVERAGMLGAERCTRTYRDGGMTCSDSSQCEGKCLAGTDAANQASITGTCQLTDNPFGCFAEVKDGKTEFALCVD